MAAERSFKNRFDDNDSDSTISDSLSLDMDTFNGNENIIKNTRKIEESRNTEYSDPLDFSLRSLQQRASMMRETKSPSVSSSRMRLRENRSPSKVYEDTLIIEKKIKGFGLFSEDLEWILMGLLRDNEEMKNIIKIGFKEVEREMQEMDDWMKNENKARIKESLELKHMLNNQYDEMDEKMMKLDKSVKNKLYEVTENVDAALTDMKVKIYQDIENQLDERIPDIEGRLNDMNAKMSLVFSDQREKLDELTKTIKINQGETEQKFNQVKQELCKTIEENMDDTTKAVVTLRKEIVEEVKDEKEDRIREQKMILSNIEKINLSANENMSEMESKYKYFDGKLESEVDSLKSALCEKEMKIAKNEEITAKTISELKNNIEQSLNAQEGKANEQFSNARDALSKTIEQTTADINCLHSKIDEETGKLNSVISIHEQKITSTSDKLNEEIKLVKGKIESQQDQQSITNNMIKTNFETMKSNFEENLKESETCLKEKIQTTSKSMKDDMRNISGKINTEITLVNELIDKEKTDILKNIETFCATLEGNVQSHLQKNNNELEMLTLKLSNERKEVEIELREDKNESLHENTFVNMLNYLGKKMSNIQSRIDMEADKTRESQKDLQVLLFKRQEDLESSLETSRLEGKQELDADKTKMLESIEQSESALVSKLSDLEVDLLAKQQESDLQLVDLRTKLEDQLQSFLSNVRLPLSISFCAFRDNDYSGKGEDYLTFTGCSINYGGAMDHKYVLYYC